MPRKSIGDQELALLQYLSGQGDASVGEVAAGYGEPRGLARSTVLTMMERLRAKSYLRRRKAGGVYRYSTATEILLMRVCHSFGPVSCTELPSESTATVTGISFTSNS